MIGRLFQLRVDLSNAVRYKDPRASCGRDSRPGTQAIQQEVGSAMKTLEPFQTAVEDPYEYARRWKATAGRAVVAHLCSYTPEEIIWAAGALPLRLFGASGAIERADAHLQAYSCSLVRGVLEDALRGRLAFLDGVVFPHTCDSIQRLSDIWRMNVPCGFHLDAVLPVKLNTDSARDYMCDVMARFRRELAQHLGAAIDDAGLRKSIALFNRLRDGLRALYQLRIERPGVLSSRALHTVMRAAMIMDRAQSADSLDALYAEATAQRVVSRQPKRLVLSGGLCSMPEVYGVIEAAGASVVWDDLCTGARFFEGNIDTAAPPLEAIAARYAERVVCPAKHMNLDHRGAHLLRLVQETQADGVIFMYLKFCDPHAFDYPYLRRMLDEAGIPSLLCELEEGQVGEGQLRTRCEAFVEML